MLKAVYQPEYCLKQFETRHICCAFHDIDGTHSLIRNWPPVMSIVLNDVIEHGLPEDFDSVENRNRLISLAGSKPLPETDRFCVESAGLSALTQMEWSIRRAVEAGTVHVDCDNAVNSRIIDIIWKGGERFDGLNDTPDMKRLLSTHTPRLFKLYEAVLNGFCRDRNLAKARLNPNEFLVRGSMEFMHMLYDCGVKNYFVTGAVVQKGMGMHEEVETLGFEIGKGKLVEDIIGSSWDKKLPKDEIMTRLAAELNMPAERLLVVGDGRSEIDAGVKMGALTMSRLPKDAHKQRSLHAMLGTHLIVADYFDPAIANVFSADND